YMTVARTLLHAEAIEGWDPDETLGRVNRILLNNSREGLFVTCVYAVVDLITGQINYANAGHNQPLCLRKGSKHVEWLRKGGMPLGVSETLQLKNESFILQPGDIVLMYTDGVTEMRNPEGDFFGEERLVNNLYSYISKPYTDLIQYLEEKFFDFQKSAVQADDLTLISLERKD
ncbi:MAG TPA: serine/threonine-protein phosphatase, partial [Candidatus Cloacimonetes bacterium]|nr:serine/threonine-protein phosphatase [Candidatus Cloacimonadota bacterium]